VSEENEVVVEDSAAFEQGFAGATSGEEQVVEQKVAETPVEETVSTEQEVETPVEAEPTIADLRATLQSAQEAIDALKQRESKVFGTVGALKQQLDELKNRSTPTAPTITRDMLKKLGAEFPELADMLAEDLGSLQSAPASVDPSAINEIVSTAMADTAKTYEKKLLTVMHPDWTKVVASDEFKVFRDTLPEAEREQLGSSWDALFIGEKLTAFKTWKAESESAKKQNTKRLAGSIPLQGTPGAAVTSDTDAFLAGFKSARNGG
jgi:hypothetical protein